MSSGQSTRTTSRLDVGSSSLPAGHSLLLNRPHKPSVADTANTVAQAAAASSSLRSRLSNFLPALAEANAAIQARIASEGRDAIDVEAVGEDERHIEMNVAITELPEGAVEDDGDADEEAGAGSSSGRGRGSGLAGLRVGPGPGGNARAKRPRIESVDGDGKGASTGASAGGNQSHSDSSSDDDNGDDADDEDGENGAGLPAGRWITDPSSLATHQAEIFKALLRRGDDDDEEEEEDEGDEGDDDDDEDDSEDGQDQDEDDDAAQ